MPTKPTPPNKLILIGNPAQIFDNLAHLIDTYGLDTTITAIIQLECQKMANDPKSIEPLLPVISCLKEAAKAVAQKSKSH